MLILVGVTISVALNGGLFNTAKDAATNTIVEAEKEQLLSAVVAAVGSNGKVDSTKISLPEGFIEDANKSTETKLVIQGKNILWQIDLNSIKIEPYTENLDISKLLNKAYTWEDSHGYISIAYIINSNEQNKLKLITIDKNTGKKPEEDDIQDMEMSITNVSSDFSPITIYINDRKVELTPNTAFLLGDSVYITEEYLITDSEIKDGDKLTTDNRNMRYSERNSTYDSYAL